MADNLSVTISASTAEFRAGLAVAESAMRDFNRQLTTTARSARTAGDELSMSKLGAAAAQWERQTAVVAGLKAQMEEVRRSAGLNRAGMMEMQAAGVNAFQALASGMDIFRVASMEGAQVIGALIQGGVLPSTGALLGMAAAAAAVAVPLGLLALQAYQVKQSLNSMSSELLLTGRLGSTGLIELDKMAEELAGKFGLSKRAAAELLDTIAKAHPLTVQQIRDFAEMAAAEAAVRKQDPNDVAKRFADQLQGGAKGAIALAAAYNVATIAAEHMLKSGDEAGALSLVLSDLKKHIDAHGGAWALARARYLEYIQAVTSAAPAEGGMTNFGQFGPIPPTPTTEPSAGPGTAGAERMRKWLAAKNYSPSAIAGIMGNAQVESGFNPAARNRTGHFGLFQWDQQRQQPLGGSTDFEKQMELMDQELTKLDANFKTTSQSAGEAAQRFERVFERSGGQGMAARERAAETFFVGGGNALEQRAAHEKVLRDSQDLLAQQNVDFRHSASEQVKIAFEHYERVKAAAGEGSREEIAAKQEFTQKAAQFYDQDTANMIAQLKAKQAAAQDIGQKIAIQQQVIGTIQARGNTGLGGGVNEAEMNSAKTELEGLKRQQGQQGFQLSEQGTAAMRQARADMLRGYQAEREQLVEIGQLSPFTALAQELEKSKLLAAENALGLSNLMDGAKSLADQTKVYWEQWREGIRASTEAQQILKRVATESKELMEKWAAPVKSALDRVGSSFESAIGGLLTGEKSIGDARSEIGKAATQGIASAGLGLLSKAGGAALGSTTGQGIGDVIGEKLIGGLFGGVLESGAQVANTTALASLTVAVIANTAAVGGAAATTAASATAGVAGGGGGGIGSIFGGIASVLGWVFGPLTGGASVVAGSAIGTGIGLGTGGLYRRGGIVPSAAGGWALPSFPGMQLAGLHAREMVLPDGEMPSSIEKRLSAMITNLGAGGGGGAGPTYNSFQISAFSPKDSVDAINKAMRLGGGQLGVRRR